jgi:hypothetical protein
MLSRTNDGFDDGSLTDGLTWQESIKRWSLNPSANGAKTASI